MTTKTWMLGLALSLFLSSQAHALLLDFNGFYFNDKVDSESPKTTSDRTAADAALAIALDQDKMFNLGFAAFYGATQDTVTDGTNIRWSTFDYGIKFATYFNRTKEWGLGISYFPFAAGKYYFADGTSQNWRGSSFHISVGYDPLLIFGIYFGIRLNYYQASYKELSLDGNIYSPQSFTRSFLYPSLYLSVRY